MRISFVKFKKKDNLKTSWFTLYRMATIIISVVLLIALLYSTMRHNHPSDEEYPVRGVDVSSYQGDIDWKVLSSQNIDFAFIKATEGSKYVDAKFKYNWENANKMHLKVGAYHFFSYDSSAHTQAQNFIKTVPKNKDSLPPVVDIEFYGDKRVKIPPIKSTQDMLRDLLLELEDYYGKKPIIYATNASYNLYIRSNFKGYDIWISDLSKKPVLSDNRRWTFWQYTNKEKLFGYKGKEKYIDMDIFYGRVEDFFYKYFRG